MGLITKQVNVKWTGKIKSHYVNKGYIFTKMGDLFVVKVEDLTNGSEIEVDVECNNCGKRIKHVKWQNYKRYVREDGKYYCNDCAFKLYGIEKMKLSKLKNSTSFAQWGIDHLGKDFLEKYWDYEKNKNIDPWEITYGTNKKVWMKCLNRNHQNYYTRCSHFTDGHRCPKCNNSKGEERINLFLINNNINYEPQKTFNGLLGLGNGLLSYDFYLSEPYNLLIEYQGEQHERYWKGIHQSRKDFEKQLEHDKRKRNYAQDNNINLLEIWYYDYDNIEQILDNYLEKRLQEVI